MKKEKGEMTIIKKRQWSKSFSKTDAKHYIIYRELSKMNIYNPFDKATKIIEAIKEANLL